MNRPKIVLYGIHCLCAVIGFKIFTNPNVSQFYCNLILAPIGLMLVCFAISLYNGTPMSSMYRMDHRFGTFRENEIEAATPMPIGPYSSMLLVLFWLGICIAIVGAILDSELGSSLARHMKDLPVVNRTVIWLGSIFVGLMLFFKMVCYVNEYIPCNTKEEWIYVSIRSCSHAPLYLYYGALIADIVQWRLPYMDPGMP